MKKYLYLAIASLILAVATSVPGLVRDGQHSNQPSDVFAQANQGNQQNNQNSNQDNQEEQSNQFLSKAQLQEVKQKLKNRKAKFQKRAKNRQNAIEPETCELQHGKVNRLVDQLTSDSTQTQTYLDTVYQRVKDFYKNQQLSANNYQRLTANANSAQVNAAASTRVVKAFQFEFDCSKSNHNRRLDRFRLAVDQARLDLQTYRDALIELVGVVREESPTPNQQNSGGNSGN